MSARAEWPSFALPQGCVAVAGCLLLAACGQQAPESQELEVEARPPVEARAAVDRAVATTGDVITYSVEVDHEKGYEITLPEPGADIAGFRIIEAGRDEPKEVGDRVVDRRWYELRADLVRSYILPAVEVSYVSPDGESGSLETSEIFVEVESVLPGEEGEAGDIRDLKPLHHVGEPLPIVWILAALLGASLAIAFWLWWRRRRAKPQLVPSEPPHVVAFRELDRLRRTDFEDLKALRRYYFEISQVVRTYVEGVFALNATDLTTEEIVARVRDVHGLPTAEAEKLLQFLIDTDQVKFAKYMPSPSEIESTYERALSFVEATRPRPSASEDASSPGGDQPPSGVSSKDEAESCTAEPAPLTVEAGAR